MGRERSALKGRDTKEPGFLPTEEQSPCLLSPEKDVRESAAGSLGLGPQWGMLRSSIQVTDPGALGHVVKESKQA